MLLDERLQDAFSFGLIFQLLALHARNVWCGCRILRALLRPGLSWPAGLLRRFVVA
jgi:hypothetical protein